MTRSWEPASAAAGANRAEADRGYDHAIDDETTPPPDTRPVRHPWWQMPWLFAAAAVIFVLALVGGKIVVERGDDGLARGDGDGVTVTTPSENRAATTMVPPTAPVPPLRSPPENVSWSRWHGIALPSSPTAGPRNPTAASGYSHDATGALLAAINILYRSSYGGDWRAVMERQIVAGPIRDELMAQRAQSDPTNTADATQVAGFRFDFYNPAAAEILLVLREKGGLRSWPHTVRWIDGDWRLDYGSRRQGGGVLIESLGTFIPWAGPAS